jgi:PAS domain S-box-containing protein/putative nucleotidyltransferase with HDIG domain
VINRRPYRVLLINTERKYIQRIKDAFAAVEPGFEFMTVCGYETELACLVSEQFDVVLIDLDNDEERTQKLLTAAQDNTRNTSVVVVIGRNNRKTGVQLRALGISDFITKEQFDGSVLLRTVQNAIEHKSLKKRLLESDARYQDLIKSLKNYTYSIPIKQYGAAGMVWDPACIAITGYTADELTADSSLWNKLVLEEDRDAVRAQTEAVLSDGVVFPLEYRIMHKDGAIRWVNNSLVPQYNENNQLIAYHGLVADITERKQMEQTVLTVYKALRASEEKLLQEMNDHKELFLETVKSFSRFIDAKSSRTAGHSERVAHYALLLGKDMGFTGRRLKDLKLAGLLHDIGKLKTQEANLEKPKVLSAVEYKAMQKHPRRGVELLKPIKQLKEILPAIWHHHERYDGTGYPAGLKGNNIPLEARILSVCDSYDAMTTIRPYREVFSKKRAVKELEYCAGSQFDPLIVEQFIKTMQRDNTRKLEIIETRSVQAIKEKRGSSV